MACQPDVATYQPDAPPTQGHLASAQVQDGVEDYTLGNVDDLDPSEWQVPPHCIPIHANVTTYDWSALIAATQFDVIMMDPPWQLATANPTRGGYLFQTTCVLMLGGRAHVSGLADLASRMTEHEDAEAGFGPTCSWSLLTSACAQQYTLDQAQCWLSAFSHLSPPSKGACSPWHAQVWRWDTAS